jgi:drug/metabolite transporter (DMT)-like permease
MAYSFGGSHEEKVINRGAGLSRPGPVRLTIFLTVGILAVSCGSIFVRLAHAPALAVSAYRVFWASILLAPALIAGPIRELRPLTRKDWGLLILSGLALGLHFALWIASLSYTSVASSVLLVDTTPFFIGLASQWVPGRSCPRGFWLGLGLAFAGCILIFGGDWSQSPNSMRGNALALGGAVAMAIYLLVGARARQKLSLISYVWPVYATSTIALFVACLASGTELRGFPGETYFFLFLLGLIPQCVGHTTYNWSLRWLTPALVALIGLAEPVGASILAYLILGEHLTAAKLAGGAIVLAGIYLASREQK